MTILLHLPKDIYLIKGLYASVFRELDRHADTVEIFVLKHIATPSINELFQFTPLAEYSYGAALDDTGLRTKSKVSYYFDLCHRLLIEQKNLNLVLSNYSNLVFLTPDVSDPLVQMVLKTKSCKSFYYLQHSNIIKERKQARFRTRLIDGLINLITGIKLTLNTKRPPFYFKEFTYLIWSQVWTNNIGIKDYRVKYFPKILPERNIKVAFNPSKSLKVLVVLNKRGFVNTRQWEEYSTFYKKAFTPIEKYSMEVVFKVHPRDQLKFAQERLEGYKVVKGQVEIEGFDVVVGHWSTFLFDAILSGKPYFLVNPYNMFDLSLFRLESYPMQISRPEDIINMIARVHEDKRPISEIEQFKSYFFGNGFDEDAGRLIRAISQ